MTQDPVASFDAMPVSPQIVHPFPSHVSLVLFDFDFTIVDAGDAICSAFRSCLDMPELSESAIRRLVGLPLREMFLSVLGQATEQQIDELVMRYRAAFAPLCLTASRPEPGAKQLIDTLSKSVQIGLVTSRLTDAAICILDYHKMLYAFDVLVGLEHVTRVKPDPEPIHIALEHLGESPNCAVMVGDTPQDVQAARAAGVGAVGVTTGAFTRAQLLAAGAHFVVDSLGELPALLEVGSALYSRGDTSGPSDSGGTISC